MMGIFIPRKNTYWCDYTNFDKGNFGENFIYKQEGFIGNVCVATDPACIAANDVWCNGVYECPNSNGQAYLPEIGGYGATGGEFNTAWCNSGRNSGGPEGWRGTCV